MRIENVSLDVFIRANEHYTVNKYIVEDQQDRVIQFATLLNTGLRRGLQVWKDDVITRRVRIYKGHRPCAL